MSDRRGDAARRTGVATGHGSPPDPGADQERILLLETRLEQMRAALAAARADADEVRTRLAETTAREADNARRLAILHDELAEARTEIAILHRHLERSEALRAELEGRLFEARPDADGRELARLRGRQRSAEERALNQERLALRLRARVEELLASRDTLLARLAEWQQLVREDGPEAADLSEFVAELRREILDLEQRTERAEAREAALRERLALVGVDVDEEFDAPARLEDTDSSSRSEEADEVGASDPTTGPGVPDLVSAPASTDIAAASTAGIAPPAPAETPSGTDRVGSIAAELEASRTPSLQSALLLRIGRSGGEEAVETVLRWTGTPDASVRAAAYEALARLLEDRPDELEESLRRGLADADTRVRRRVALAAATARQVDAAALLAPLAEDPDPQLRRLVRRVSARARMRGDAAPNGKGASRPRAPAGAFP